MNSKLHWETVYDAKKPTEVSWYQNDPAVSLELIASTKIDFTQKIIDVGAGASILVDKLLKRGFIDITVLDISSKAIQYSQERLKESAEMVKWIEADIVDFKTQERYDLWHDRAVFHFLTNPQDRIKYVHLMEETIKPGGHLIIGAFSLEGPLKCSGLEVERYDVEKMKGEVGKSFELVKNLEEVHITPNTKEQKFIYCYFKRLK